MLEESKEKTAQHLLFQKVPELLLLWHRGLKSSWRRFLPLLQKGSEALVMKQAAQNMHGFIACCRTSPVLVSRWLLYRSRRRPGLKTLLSSCAVLLHLRRAPGLLRAAAECPAVLLFRSLGVLWMEGACESCG